MKSLLITIILISPSFSQTEPQMTVPVGVVKVTVAGADAAGQRKLSAISATLLKKLEFSGLCSIGTFIPESGSAPDIVPSSQSVSVAGASWALDQWTIEPYLAYISDSTGAEEAFLITGSNSDSLTLSTTFDLQGDSDPDAPVIPKFPPSTTVKIRKANTIGSIFSDSANNLGSGDRVYVWSGTNWETYVFVSFWRNYSALGINASNDVIFPEEGLFVDRGVEPDVTLTLSGEIPSAPQIGTISNVGLLSSRFPVDTTLIELGVHLSNWQLNDRLYIWDSAANPSGEWVGYRFILDSWRGVDSLSTIANSTVITANSAVFVLRETEIPEEQSGITSSLPYDPFSD